MEIRKNQIGLKLKDGSEIVLNKEDYDSIISQIRTDVVIKMLIEMPNSVYFETNANEKNIQNLYRIFTEQQKTMSEDLKNNYLKLILELSKSEQKSVISFEDMKKINKV